MSLIVHNVVHRCGTCGYGLGRSTVHRSGGGRLVALCHQSHDQEHGGPAARSAGDWSAGGRLVSRASVRLASCPEAIATGRQPWTAMGRAGPKALEEGIGQEQRKADLREANLSTQHAQAGEAPWLPPPDVHARRTCDPEGEAAQGASSAHRLSWPVSEGHAMGAAVARISGRRAFQALARPAGRGRSGPLRVAFSPDGGGPAPRIGYAIGRRHGTAVRRNRLRRRLRAAAGTAVRTQPERFPAGAYLVSADITAAGLGYGELERHVAVALSRAAGTLGAQRKNPQGTPGHD